MSTENMDRELFQAEFKDNGIVVVRLKRHLMEHFMDLSHKECFLQFLDRLNGNPDSKCIVILGHPEKRGAPEFQEWFEKVQQSTGDAVHLQRVVNAFQQLVRRLLTLPQLVLFGEAGTMTTNYIGIGMASDYFVLGDKVDIQNVNAEYNIPPAGALSYLMNRRIGASKTIEALAARKKLTSAEALELGLCDAVCAADQLESQLLQKAQNYAEHSLAFLLTIKKNLCPNLHELDEIFKSESRAIVNSMLK